MKRISSDFPLLPALVANLLALGVMWLCRGGVGAEDSGAVFVFLLVVLLLANEFWGHCLILPAILLGRKKLAPEEERRCMGRLLRWTSPAMFAAPVAAWLLVWLFLRVFAVCGVAYSSWWDALPGQFGATLAGVAVLFVIDLFKPVIPLSVLSFLGDESPRVEVQHKDFHAVEAPPELPVTDIPVRHSEWYDRHELQIRRMLQPGERILLATAPDVETLRKYSPLQKATGLWVGMVLLGLFSAVVLVWAFHLEPAQCGAAVIAALIGFVLTFSTLRSLLANRREPRRRDYFITTARFCRFSGAEEPCCISWKDVEGATLSLLEGSETGNIHLPRKSIITKTLGKLFGAKPKDAQVVEQGCLQGLECVPSAAAVYRLIREQLDKLPD